MESREVATTQHLGQRRGKLKCTFNKTDSLSIAKRSEEKKLPKEIDERLPIPAPYQQGFAFAFAIHTLNLQPELIDWLTDWQSIPCKPPFHIYLHKRNPFSNLPLALFLLESNPLRRSSNSGEHIIPWRPLCAQKNEEKSMIRRIIMVGLILCISSSTRMLFVILLTWDVLVSQNHRLPAHSSSSSSAVCAAAPPSADMRIHGYNIGKFVALPFHSIVEIIPSENHVAFAIMFHQTMRGDES